VIEPTEKADADSIVAVAAHWEEGCSRGIGLATMAHLLNEPYRFRADAEWPCSSLRPIHAIELRELMQDAGYVPGDGSLAAPAVPCYSASGRSPCTRTNTEGDAIYVAYNNSEIQVVRGEYGNRSGYEIEHTYRVSQANAIETTRAVVRRVAYDRFPDWW
jgi:hypothetical protein